MDERRPRLACQILHCMQTTIGKAKTLKVSYGSAKFAPSGRGKVCLPPRRAYKECACRFQSASRTSFGRRWSITECSRLEKVRRYDTKRWVQACNGVVIPTKRNATSSIGITAPRSTYGIACAKSNPLFCVSQREIRYKYGSGGGYPTKRMSWDPERKRGGGS